MGSTYFYILFSCLIVICAGYSSANICQNNEEYSKCTQAVCRAQNCTQIGEGVPCPEIDEEFCEQGCICVEGTLRNRYGTCVPDIDCSDPTVCGKYEEFNPCTSYCYNDACPENLDDESGRACIEICGPANCECIKNYRRDSNGDCIPIEECPSQQCNAPYEELACVQECPPEKSCRNRDIKFSCYNDGLSCQKKCVCKKGYFRNAVGECITGAECDQCQGKNEYFSCGPECDNVCADLATQNMTNCPIVNIQCNRKCYCADGFARDNNNICVPISECPAPKPECPLNEEYVDCKRSCPPELCFSIVAKFRCPEKPKCEPGCTCKSGFLRKNVTSPCVTTCECPELSNSPDCKISKDVYV